MLIIMRFKSQIDCSSVNVSLYGFSKSSLIRPLLVVASKWVGPLPPLGGNALPLLVRVTIVYWEALPLNLPVIDEFDEVSLICLPALAASTSIAPF